MRQKTTWVAALLLGCCSLLQAHDFSATLNNGQRIYFNIVSAKNKQIEVTYQGSVTEGHSSSYKGEIVVPDNVKHKNTVYKVVGIGKKAFSNATELTGVILPPGLTTIGDFAFEGCTSLQKIIFPGNQVRMGQGVFFRCTNISEVLLGSDWTQVDLKMFRWSEKLTDIFIPAKLTRLQNMKSLKALQRVLVSNLNPNFSDVKGILYNKEKTILLGCPRAYYGTVEVPEGVKQVRWGAFIDCTNITSVDLPASLSILSYREFSRMKQLERIIMRNTAPIFTAVKDGEKVFALQIAEGADVKLMVPKISKKLYKETICSAEGEYCEISGNTPEGVSPEYALVPRLVKTAQLVSDKAVEGVKDFAKLAK